MQKRTTANENVGRNVAALRGSRSQGELANELAQRLGKDRIDPTTITRLEAGKRPITVNELVALADILSVDVPVLLSTPKTSELEKVSSLLETMARVREAREAMDRARAKWLGAREHLRIQAERVDRSKLRRYDQEELDYMLNESDEDTLSKYGSGLPPF
ncbi:helix-turn-helix transcriptional regulator [Gordonia polyisoprenivorans]|uniref:helix-turn-helix domain-containing protein n=1 Tax=Gordonia polyisoprenivorans TaxID=84595 RepID=UPI001B8B8EE2|nr:helix-turn-helix transcriptional regulator [Gordonia polyisoprenivorans]QUD82105.1 helix-turn-helix transcriptional regulator [Gordonia polyisoprenivorans]